MPVVTAGHIDVDEKGVARIAGSRIKVLHIAVDKSQGMSVEQIQEAHPHLSLAEIYAALSYYHDHKLAIDKESELDEREVEAMRKAAGQSPVVKKLRAMGKLA